VKLVVPCAIRKWAYAILRRWLWNGDSRPTTMFRRGRGIVPIALDDILCFRWFNDFVEKDGSLRPANIFIPDQSMNRRRFPGFRGRCWHVLIPNPEDDSERASRNCCTGVVQLRAADVTLETSQNGVLFSFRVDHDPLEHNYGHCELRVYRNGVRLQKLDADGLKYADKVPWTAAKKWFRTEVAKVARNREFRLVLRPEVSTKGAAHAPTAGKGELERR